MYVMDTANSKFDTVLHNIGYAGAIKFKNGRRTVKVCCPIPEHDDHDPSLQITEREDGELLVHCFAGCDGIEVLRALGMWEDRYDQYNYSASPPKKNPKRTKPKEKKKTKYLSLQLSELSESKALPLDYLKSHGITQSKWYGHDAVYIPYYNLDGSRANRARYRLKKVDNEGEIKSTYVWRGTEDIVPYGLHKLDLVKPNRAAFIVEGETDALTLWMHDLPALGVPGATLSKCLKLKYLLDIKILYAIDEKDDAGKQFVTDVAKRLVDIGWEGALKCVRMPDGVKDPNELYMKLQERDIFIEQMQEACIAGDLLRSTPEGIVKATDHEADEDRVDADPDFEPIPPPKREKASEFPVSVFPKKTREFLELASKGLQTQPDLIGLHMLAALGSAIGNSREIEILEGWTRRANLYACLIARPGSAKSRAQELATEPIEDLQNEAFELYNSLDEEYKIAHDAFELELNQWKKESRPIEERPEEPAKPLLNHYFLNNSTTERLIQILEYNHRGVAFVFDELNAWLQSMGQYKGGKGADKELYLSLWSNRTIKVDRVKDDGRSINVPKPFVSVFGNLPPDELPKMVTSEGSTGEGFIDRVLFSYPEEKDFAHLTRDGISKRIRKNYKEIIYSLYALQPAAAGNGYMQPATVRMSDPVWNLFKSWCDQQIDEINDKKVPDRLVGVWRKMENQLASLTLIMHQLRFVEGEVEDQYEIDEVSMLCGMELADYFKAHAKKVFGKLGRSPANQRVLDAVEWIKSKGGKVKKRDVQRAGVVGCEKGSEVEELFEELEDYGFGIILKESRGRGRPTIYFSLGD